MPRKLTLVTEFGEKSRGWKRIEGSIYTRKDSDSLYVCKRFSGLRIPRLVKSLKTNKISKARALADQAIHQHLEQFGASEASLREKRDGKLFSEVANEILQFEKPKKRAKTQKNYDIYFGELIREWGQWGIDRITPDAFAVWLSDFRKRKKRKTFSDYAKYMNIGLHQAYKKKYITHFVKVENPDPASRAGRVYSEKEIESLWSVMGEETRDQFVLSYECFMRLREALFLTWDRIDFKSETIHLRAEDVKTGSKTGKGRTFKLSANALARLKRRYRSRASDVYVFPSPSDYGRPIAQNKTAWANAKRKAGVTGRARWHDLRHTALTRALLERKANPIMVSEYAGVSMRTIQRVYLHSTADQTAEISKVLSVVRNNWRQIGDKRRKR